MEKKVTKIYIRPFTEVIMVENTQSHLTNFSTADHDPVDDGGVINAGDEESKRFFDWSHREREGLTSDKMGNSFDD